VFLPDDPLGDGIDKRMDLVRRAACNKVAVHDNPGGRLTCGGRLIIGYWGDVNGPCVGHIRQHHFMANNATPGQQFGHGGQQPEGVAEGPLDDPRVSHGPAEEADCRRGTGHLRRDRQRMSLGIIRRLEVT
jgi:hypothetical protein